MAVVNQSKDSAVPFQTQRVANISEKLTVSWIFTFLTLAALVVYGMPGW